MGVEVPFPFIGFSIEAFVSPVQEDPFLDLTESLSCVLTV